MKLDIERARKFIKDVNWVFAKTYAETAPHEYVVKRDLSPELQKEFDWFAKMIFENGVEEFYYSHKNLYLHIGGLKYWSMDKSSEKTDLINRADKK